MVSIDWSVETNITTDNFVYELQLYFNVLV